MNSIKVSRIVSWVILAQCGVVISYGQLLARHPQQEKFPSVSEFLGRQRHIFHVRPITLGCEKPGVQIFLAADGSFGHPTEAFERISVVDGGESIARNIDDLRGHVDIRDGAAALKFVRLITSPETWFVWPNRTAVEIEIVDRSTYSSLPNYGLPPEHKRLFVGALPQNEFVKAGIHPAVVAAVQGGFQVTRWIYLESVPGAQSRTRIQRIREFVGFDGAYKRTILVDRQRPKEGVAGSRLRFPFFE